MRLKWFKDKEVEGLDKHFAEMLDHARENAGVPFVITSGFRTDIENTAAGGVPGSSHVQGLAADIRANDSRTRFCVVSGLMTAGFRRIGIYDKHVHADFDETKEQDVIWTGSST